MVPVATAAERQAQAVEREDALLQEEAYENSSMPEWFVAIARWQSTHEGGTRGLADAGIAGTVPEESSAAESAGAEDGAISGAAIVRKDQAGEDAVRSVYDIGAKATVAVAGRTRILDGLNDDAVSEAKIVKYQAFTLQLQDSLAYAQQNGLRFDLYIAPETTLSGPLRDAIARGEINLRYIP